MRRFSEFLEVGVLAGLLAIAGCEISDEYPVAQPTTRSAPASAGIVTGDVQFVTRDLNEGFRLAQRDGKPLMLFFTAKDCHFCHELAADAFRNREVVSLSQQFVCVLIDADAQPQLCQRFGVRAYPTVQFLSPRGHALTKMVGKRPAAEVARTLEAALHAGATARRNVDDLLL